VTRVLFVCLGNICRSPLAHGLLRHAIDERGLGQHLSVDSCGTSAYHNGGGSDPGSVSVAHDHGIDISDLISRKLTRADYSDFDLLVGMDRQNERDIRAQQPPGAGPRIVRFMDFVPGADSPDVPDPYYGGPRGFELIYQLIDAGMGPLIDFALGLADDPS